MKALALAVVVAHLAVSAWALRARPGALAVADLLHVWRFSPWGKQLFVDFYGLEVVLGIWMISHALANDALALAVACLALMPILGALPAAAYLLIAG